METKQYVVGTYVGIGSPSEDQRALWNHIKSVGTCPSCGEGVLIIELPYSLMSPAQCLECHQEYFLSSFFGENEAYYTPETLRRFNKGKRSGN